MKFLLHLAKHLKSFIFYPFKTTNWFAKDLKKDIFFKNTISKYRFVWCAGLPKSGTTLIENIFDYLPYVRFNSSILRIYDTRNLDHGHGISDKMFTNIPENKYTFLKTHTHFSKKYEDIAIKKNAKIIISVRDLRDMLISRYYHIKSDHNHWLHNKLKNLNFSDGFLISLKEKPPSSSENSLTYYYFWIKNWILEGKKKNYLILWFEEYKKEPIKYINKILEYTDNKNFSAEKIYDNIKNNRNTNNLSQGLKNYGRSKSTFRKGAVGEWYKLFDNKISSYFYNNIPGDIKDIEFDN